MMKEKREKIKKRQDDRRQSDDRRSVHTDSEELPFPDQRKDDRRQRDRRVYSDEERVEILRQVEVDQ